MKLLRYSPIFLFLAVVLSISAATSTLNPIVQAVTANQCSMSNDKSAIDAAALPTSDCFTDGAILETIVLRKLALCVTKPVINSASVSTNTDLSDCEFLIDKSLDPNEEGLTVQFTQDGQTTLPFKYISKKKYNYVLAVADNLFLDKTIVKFTNNVSTAAYYTGSGTFTPEWQGQNPTAASGTGVSTPTSGTYCYTTGKTFNMYGYLRKNPLNSPIDLETLTTQSDQANELAVLTEDWSKRMPEGPAYACGSQTDAQNNAQANKYRITGIGGWDSSGNGTVYFLSQTPGSPNVDPVLWSYIGNYSEKNNLRIPTLNGTATKTEYIVYIAKNPVDLTSTSSKTLKIKSPMKKIADGGLGGVAVLFNNSKLQTIDGTPNLIFE